MSSNVIAGFGRDVGSSAAPSAVVAAIGVPDEAGASSVSWAAVVGGAFVASALSLILIALGSGLGLMSVSPWAHAGASVEAIAVGSVVWLCAMQLVSAAAGGYVAGRLRTRWATVHSDEVYFRDTAHGLLVWAVGVVISAAVLTSAASGLLSGTGRAAATLASGATQAVGTTLGDAPAATGGSVTAADYSVDLLMRSEQPPSATARDPAQRGEFGRLLVANLRQGQLSSADRSYLAGQVAVRTGLTQAAAEQRVDEVFAEAKKAGADAEVAARQIADTARRTAASFSLWLFLSFLIGAFSASYAGTIGGRQRDNVRARE